MNRDEILDWVFFYVKKHGATEPQTAFNKNENTIIPELRINLSQFLVAFEDVKNDGWLEEDGNKMYVVSLAGRNFKGYVYAAKKQEGLEKNEKKKTRLLIISILVAVISIIVNGVLYLDKNFDKQMIELQKQQLQEKGDSINRILDLYKEVVKQKADTSKK